MDKATLYEEQGDKVNAEKWFNLAVKAEEYYAKQGYKTMDEIKKEKND